MLRVYNATEEEAEADKKVSSCLSSPQPGDVGKRTLASETSLDYRESSRPAYVYRVKVCLKQINKQADFKESVPHLC